MGLQHDQINAEYQEVEAITKARDEQIITSAEYDTLIFAKKNELRKLFQLEPIVE